MDRIGCLGISWRDGGPEVLARFTVPACERGEWMLRVARETGVPELVCLATCNRVEIVFVNDGHTPLTRYRAPFFEAMCGCRPRPGEAERTLRAWGGEGAAEHLFLVASGLDSARVGESEIAGQVREAYEQSRALGLTGPRLEFLFEQAFRIAARVRTRTSIATGRESLAEIALAHLRQRLRRTPGALAVIGVSAMTERCARSLASPGTEIYIANRTFDRADALAATIGAHPRSLASFLEDPPPVEAVLCATSAAVPVLRRAHLERLAARSPSGEAPLVVDMAVPPDVDPLEARDAGVPRIGMERIIDEASRNRDRHLVEAAEARELVDEAVIDFNRRLTDRVLAPLFAAVQRRYRQTAVEGVDRLFRKELDGLGGAEREAVRAWAVTLARRFAHLPTAGLRGVAYEVGPAAVEAFLAHADETMMDLVRDARSRSDIALASDAEWK